MDGCRVGRSTLARGTGTSPCCGGSPIPELYDISSSATCSHRDGNSCGGSSVEIVWGGYASHSPTATLVTEPVEGLTTRVHTLRKMCPLMARDGRLVSAAPLAIIEAAGEGGLVLAMRLARPCRGTIRFL